MTDEIKAPEEIVTTLDVLNAPFNREITLHGSCASSGE